MKKVSLLCIALVACILVACGSKEKESESSINVVGTWVNILVDGTETITLKEDMTYDMHIVLTTPPPVETYESDTYSLDGNKITINYSRYGLESEYTVSIEGDTMIWTVNDKTITYYRQ